MLGPFPEPTTGVSLANKVAKEIFNKAPNIDVSIINTSYNRFDEQIGKFSFHKLLFYLSFYFRFGKVLRKDIIYITPGQSFFGVAKYSLFIILAKLFGKEIIMHIHGNHLGNEYHSLTGFKKKFFKYLVSKTDKGIVLSESLKGNMTPFISEEKIFVLYNFAEDYLIQKENPTEVTEMRIIYLSNLMEEKGVFYLLQALGELERNNIPYRAKIAGAIDAENKDKAESMLASLSNTEYLGIVRGDQKTEFLAWGNTFVLPTFYQMEGQPISILEAMATGNTIITTKHAGIPDIIKEGTNGYFVEKQEVESLYKKLSFLSANPEEILRLSINNRKEFQQKYTLKQFEISLLQIINHG